MAGQKKTAATLRQDITDFLAALGNGGEQHVRDALSKYKLLLLQKKRSKNKRLSLEQEQLLGPGSLHDDYLQGKSLYKREKKLRAAEKQEASNTVSVITAATVTTAINIATATITTATALLKEPAAVIATANNVPAAVSVIAIATATATTAINVAIATITTATSQGPI